MMADIIARTFSKKDVKDSDSKNKAKYDGTNLEKALIDHLGKDVCDTPLRDLRKLPANAHNPKLRVSVTTIQYD